MSTQVYYGYRTSLSHLKAATDWIHLSMWRRVIQYGLLSLKDETNPSKVKLVRDSLGTCGFHVWADPESDQVLIALYGSPFVTEPRREGAKRWAKRPPWIEEYSYWNNSDKPSGISQRAFDERGKVWHRVALNDENWHLRLTAEVLPVSSELDVRLLAECSKKYRKLLRLSPSRLLSSKLKKTYV